MVGKQSYDFDFEVVRNGFYAKKNHFSQKRCTFVFVKNKKCVA